MLSLSQTLCRAAACCAAGFAAALGACAAPAPRTELPPPRLLGSDLPAFVAGDAADDAAADDPAAAPDPTGRLSLRDSLAVALLRHPRLAAASWEIRAAEARALQAGLPSNPELELAADEFGGNGERSGLEVAELSVGLSQEILLAGKLDKRAAVARLEGQLAGWDYEAARLDVLTETVQAFTQVLAAQERLELADGAVGLGTAMMDAVAEQVRAGKVPPLDENRARVALALEQLDRDRAARDLAVRRRVLAASWGGASALFEEADGAFHELRPVPAPDAVANLLSQNPEIARRAVEVELHRARIDLQRAGRVPDVTVSAGVTHYRDDGGEAFGAALSVPLPVFDANEAGVLEALADRRRARAEWAAAALRVRAELFTAYQDLAASHAEAQTLRDTILPSAEAAYAAADQGFRGGKFGYMDVLDAQRTLFEVERQLVDALAAYHTAVADVERLIGQSLSSIDDQDETAGAARARGDDQ